MLFFSVLRFLEAFSAAVGGFSQPQPHVRSTFVVNEVSVNLYLSGFGGAWSSRGRASGLGFDCSLLSPANGNFSSVPFVCGFRLLLRGSRKRSSSRKALERISEKRPCMPRPVFHATVLFDFIFPRFPEALFPRRLRIRDNETNAHTHRTFSWLVSRPPFRWLA